MKSECVCGRGISVPSHSIIFPSLSNNYNKQCFSDVKMFAGASGQYKALMHF